MARSGMAIRKQIDTAKHIVCDWACFSRICFDGEQLNITIDEWRTIEHIALPETMTEIGKIWASRGHPYA